MKRLAEGLAVLVFVILLSACGRQPEEAMGADGKPKTDRTGRRFPIGGRGMCSRRLGGKCESTGKQFFSEPEEQVVEKIKAVLAEDQEIESISIATAKR